MKTCTKCKTEKDETEFSKDKNSKDGLDSRCKSCMREYQQTDVRKEYQKAYLQTDTYKEYQKAYAQTDAYKEKHREYRKAHRQTDAFKEKNREYMQAYRLRKKAATSSGNAGQSGDTIGAQE